MGQTIWVCPTLFEREMKMDELRNKFIEAINSIDFGKLSIYELKMVAEISQIVNEMMKKDYLELISETLKSPSVNSCCCEIPKTISEMGKEK